MKKRNYDEASVVRSLSKKNSIYVDTINHVIEVIKDSVDVGNGSWGKIDYLCKVHNYIVCFTVSLTKKSFIKKDFNDDEVKVNKKLAKREAKLNMAAMVKSTMHKVKTK